MFKQTRSYFISVSPYLVLTGYMTSNSRAKPGWWGIGSGQATGYIFNLHIMYIHSSMYIYHSILKKKSLTLKNKAKMTTILSAHRADLIMLSWTACHRWKRHWVALLMLAWITAPLGIEHGLNSRFRCTLMRRDILTLGVQWWPRTFGLVVIRALTDVTIF